MAHSKRVIDLLFIGSSRLLTPFEKLKGRGIQIKALFHEQEAYALFRKHIDGKLYALAYAMLSDHPDFRSTSAFIQLERSWQKHFKRASLLLQKVGDEEAASAL